MHRCKGCKINKYRLCCLACESKADNSHRIIKPEIITPLKKLSLIGLTDKEKVVLLGSIIAEISTRRFTTLLSLSRPTVISILRRAKKKIKGFKVF